MRKNLTLILLLFIPILFYGCSKNTTNDCPVSLLSVDINSLSNKDILNVVNNSNLEEGIYKIITKNNNYIFFNGKKKEFINIGTKLENKTLLISCDTTPCSYNNKKLYIIKEKNINSSENKTIFYNEILLNINNKNFNFISVYTFN